MEFSLEKFEAHAYGGDLEMAMRQLVALLNNLDANYGGVDKKFHAQPLSSVTEDEAFSHVWTRAAGAASALLANKDLFISQEWRIPLLTLQRWLAALFAATTFQNTDHIMRALNRNTSQEDLSSVSIAAQDMLKFCFLYTPDAEVPLNIDRMWEHDQVLAVSLAMMLLSPRFIGTPSAHSKREILLPWLTSHLPMIPDLELLPVGVLHDVYMHCSYADRADKHDVKLAINALIKRKLKQDGVIDTDFSNWDAVSVKTKGKPVLLVVLEWFSSAHSIYRTHSRTIEAAREHFHVVAMAYENTVDEVTKQVFDEFVPIQQDAAMIDQLTTIQREANHRHASMLYMPSVGMFPLTMWLANLRVAPIQAMALGHPATTHSNAIDYVVVEEDYVGDEACFSEKLLTLPSDGMPYRASGALP
ncbi:peptide transporter, partial [Pandoraea sp. NPDC090278]|uniref:peptide transporter n=1 Tax=Pandoraea sp. NPDC090278 TaxID=3364391 RepID=UPI00383BF5BE